MKKRKWPPIGHRIIKSALAVLTVYFIYYLRGFQGIPFYSAIGAIQCIQPYKESSKKVAVNRAFGTLNGAVFGMITILIDMYFIADTNQFGYFLLVSFMIVPLMYSAIVCKYPEVSYFSSVVFLSIVINHVGDENPILFVLNRMLDTAIGIVVAMIINNASVPKKRDTNTLFVTGLDETLLTKDEKMTPYSKVELNRMIEKGLQFTIATERTLASLIEANKGINLKLPVVVFNGAVLYDLKQKQCLQVQEIPRDIVEQLRRMINEAKFSCFTTGLVQENMMIFYDDFYSEVEESLYNQCRLSPYRNYHKGEILPETKSFYLMAIGENSSISKLYHLINKSEWGKQVRMVRTLSSVYPGNVFLKIYHNDCLKQETINELQKNLKLKRTLTIGTIPSQYDIVLSQKNENETVKSVKKHFEHHIWEKEGEIKSF